MCANDPSSRIFEFSTNVMEGVNVRKLLTFFYQALPTDILWCNEFNEELDFACDARKRTKCFGV